MVERSFEARIGNDCKQGFIPSRGEVRVMFSEILERVRAVCRSLPETTERLSHGAPTFFVRDKKSFATLMNDHHGDGRLALWCAAPAGVQQALQAEAPNWFFVPPYVGYRGWIGVRLDRDPDWGVVAELLTDAYCVVAPKALVALLDP